MQKNHRVGISRYIAPHPSYGWYVKTLAVFALLAGLILGGASWLYQQQMLKAIGLSQLANDPDLFQQQSLNMLVFSVTLSGLAMACYFLLVGAFYFHRVAGPVYRLKRHMLDVLNGDQVGALKLRQTDQLLDVAEVYNELLLKLNVIEKPAEPEQPD